ncbi:HEAT repeat domain-containing protein [Oscillatoria acuminata]|uniref:HEAT repeat-containing protein n=1 Tax=Oscillatoria acuminata PCC 6304 TaxID=56110 RepID=K9TNY3_9CYAN|nr:HEAT repeat domain-containing protein [Oscillatoria acuminata]AFY83724.1 HEAT repeat-containing protein [Oscillatoria acuminata PCC 6304]
MTISIFTTDTNLIVRTWDPRLAQMTGLSGETAVGLHLGTLAPDFSSRGFATRFERVLTEGVVETLAPALHHYLIPCPPLVPSKYFEYMQQRVTIGPLRDKERVVGTIVTIEDVTPRLEQEQELAEQLQRSPSVISTPVEAPLSPEPDTAVSFANFPILQALQDKNWQVRREAVDLLAQESDPNLTSELLQLLRNEHRNPGVLNGVLQVLAVSQVDLIPALVECLKDSDPDLRIYAALALGERADPRAITPLIEALEDANANVRYHAIDALGQLRSPEAVEPLVAIAESNDFFLAFPALDALMRICDSVIAPRLLPLLKNTLSWRVRREAVDNLAQQNDPAINIELLRMLREQHRNPNVLNSVLQILVLSDLDPIPSLVECLKDSDPDLRIYTALALGERHDARATPALIEALDDPDTNVIYHAIEALGRLRAVDAVEPLISIAESGDFFLAFPAIDALIRIGDRTIAPRLAQLLEQNQLIGPQIADALGQLGDADVVKPLARLFNLEQQPIIEIAQAIAAIYHRYETQFGEGIHIHDLTRSQISSVGQQNLIAQVKKANAEALNALALILGWLEGEAIAQTLAQLLSTPGVRELAASALIRLGTPATQLLIEQLNAEDLETRKAAIIALGQIGSSQSVPALMEQLLNSETELVMITTTALAQIGDRSSYEALIALLGHPEISVRLGAIAALNSLGHPAMPQRVFMLLGDANPYIRESAIKIAGYFAYPNCIDLLFELCQDPEERVRRAAIEHLPYLEQDQRALRVLLSALTHDTPSVRAAAARACGEIEQPLAYDYLLQALEDEEAWVRYYAICAIAKLTNSEPKTPEIPKPSSFFKPTQSLFEILQNLALRDRANPVRAAATEALGYFGQEQAVPILAAIAEEEGQDPDLVRAALRALGRIEHPSALAPLLNALNSPQAERRLDALQAFKERGGTEAGVALQWLGAADPETRVVQAAIESLARMGTPSAVASLLDLTVDPTCRDCCIQTLATRGGTYQSKGCNSPTPHPHASIEAYIEAIGRGLRHVHPAVRTAVVEILTRLKHPEASELLILALDDSDPHVRLAAVTALGHLGNHACEDKLVILARTDSDTTVRRAARKILQS